MSVKKMATGEVCLFSGSKTAENGSASAQREDRKVCDIF